MTDVRIWRPGAEPVYDDSDVVMTGRVLVGTTRPAQVALKVPGVSWCEFRETTGKSVTGTVYDKTTGDQYDVRPGGPGWVVSDHDGREFRHASLWWALCTAIMRNLP